MAKKRVAAGGSAHLTDGPDCEPSLLRNTNFRRLWSAQLLSQIAQNLLNFALIIRVYNLAQGTRLANISVALVVLAFGVPSIIFAAAAGVYTDHWNRKWVLVITNVLRAGLVLFYLDSDSNLIAILLLSFVISSVTQFFAPAEASSLPVLVKGKDLLKANSLFIFTLYASFIIGYSSSAPVIRLFGFGGPYTITAIMFGLAAVLTLLLPSIRAEHHNKVPFRRVVATTQREVLRNAKLIRDNHNLSFPILQLTLTQGTIGVLVALAPALSIAVLRHPLQSSADSLILPAGIGLVAGILAVGRLERKVRRARLIAVGMIAASSTLMLIGLTGQLHRMHHGHALAGGVVIAIIVAVLVFILGFMNAVISSSAQTLLQEHTTDQTRGKVFGALNMMVNVAATLPILLAATVADLTSVTKVIFGLGGLLLIYGIYQFTTVRRHEKLERQAQ